MSYGIRIPSGTRRLCASRLLVLCVTLVSLGAPAFAQRDTGSLVGTVRDSTGAVLPKASVTVINLATNISVTVISDDSGNYVVTPLRVGMYRIKAEAPQFAPQIIESVTLNVDQRLRVDLQLRVGSIEQTVTITEAPPALNTQDATVGQVIGSSQIEDMPLNGRNFQTLASLVPGAIPSYGARDSNGGGVSLSGTRSFDNTFLLDGVDNNTNTAELPTRVNIAISPNLDAIQEFKIQSSSYDAQYGRSVGGVINIVSKSGTNKLHGTLYDYHRNSALNANTWQNNKQGIPKGARIRNQFGGVVGGPVIIPGLYNGKDRTFFFFDYEGTREILPPGFLSIQVPDDRMRAGDFSEFLPGSNNNPTGTAFVLKGPFVNNVLPASQFDAVAKGLVALYPEPNVSGTLNYQTNLRNTFDEDRIGSRVDHHFSDKDSIFGRFNYDYITQRGTTWSDLLGPTTQNKTDGLSFVVSETHIFRPNLINELRAGYTRSRPYRLLTAPDRDLQGELGLTGFPFLPNMPTGFFRWGGVLQMQAIGRRSGYYNDLGIVRDYVDNLSWVAGRHSFRFGGELRFVRFTHFESQAPRGDFQFPGRAGDEANAVDDTGNPLAVGFAQFLTGLPTRVSASTANDIIYRQSNYSFYAQDSYRVTNSLTLNLGVRYEYYSPVTERHDQQANFDLDRGVLVYPASRSSDTLPVAIQGIPLDRNGSSGLVTTDKNNWAPRLGFAYSMNPKTVIRGGYGIYYGFQEIGPWSYPSPGYNPPYNMVWSPSPSPLSGGYVLDPLGDPAAQFQIASLPAKMHTPRLQQWNLSAQRELANGLTFEANYSGAAGKNLYALIYFNQAVPGTSFDDLESRLVFPYLQDTSQQTNNGSYSRYHALLLKTEKRFSKGLSFLASYTFSHTLDNASDANLGSSHAGDTFRDPRHLNWEYGNSDFDVRHRFVFSGIYDLPFGAGKAYGAHLNKLADAFIGGWQLSGILTLQTGYWFTPFGVNDSCYCNDGNASSLRPDAVGNPNSGPKTVDQWFNLSAFDINVPDGRHGNTGRNTILGPGFSNFDLGLRKAFRFTESKKLEFRAEFFDLTNHPNWDRPVIDYGNDNVGRILSSRTAREIQLALKFVY